MQQFSPKRFGKKGESAVTKCLTQHHGIHTDLTLYTKTLNAEQHDEALASLIFLLKY